ncbi:hypothetical protein [Hasllibacter sp. MH4015]|uniref:hypothetical protein n=1 Tax=Hasllibacter sp. MH4015 TaxID=2854029 RepID=UPI001CD64AD8|nr:hypothetical protein [Hasllibacter sp. MH4015]
MPFRHVGILYSAAALLAWPAVAQSDGFLTRDQLETHMRESVFCYYPSPRFSCAWAELYTEFNDDHTVLQSASATWDEPMSVLEFRIEWDGDALCIDHETQGLLSAREAEGYRFPFSLSGLNSRPDAELPGLVETFREGSTPDACFRYTYDPLVEGQLLQHVFYGGVEQADRDPIALIPLFAGGVSINPG